MAKTSRFEKDAISIARDMCKQVGDQVVETVEMKYISNDKFREYLDMLHTHPDQSAAMHELESGISLMCMKEISNVYAKLVYGIEHDEKEALKKTIEVFNILVEDELPKVEAK